MSSDVIFLTVLSVIAVIGLERIFSGLERSAASLSKAEQDSLCVLYSAYLHEAEQTARMIPQTKGAGSNQEEQGRFRQQRQREEEAYRAFQKAAQEMRERKAIEMSGRQWTVGSFERLTRADAGQSARAAMKGAGM